MARRRRRYGSVSGWVRQLFRQPPADLYGRTAVYLCRNTLEVEHFQRIRAYDDGSLCLELDKGLLTIYGAKLQILTLSAQRITLRGEISRTEFSREALQASKTR